MGGTAAEFVLVLPAGQSGPLQAVKQQQINKPKCFYQQSMLQYCADFFTAAICITQTLFSASSLYMCRSKASHTVGYVIWVTHFIQMHRKEAAQIYDESHLEKMRDE